MPATISRHSILSRAVALPALVVAMVSAACSSTKDKASDTAAAPASAAATAQPVAGDTTQPKRDSTASNKLSDANILAAEANGDSAEVVIAGLAKTKATSPAVRAYAALLVSDHSKGLAATHALAQKLAITPQAAPQDTTTQSTAHVLDRLNGIPKGKAFDTAFVNHEIQDHQQDIQDAQTMSGAATNPEVKNFIDKSLPELNKHLDRAQKIAGTSSSKP
jgi:putative membrane protein